MQEQLRNVQDIQATNLAFAGILDSGAVVTWGDQEYGGDSSQVQEQLRNVKGIQATAAGAFAAILDSGAVVTWGVPDFGGDSSQVQEQLRNLQHIQATRDAFAAILDSGAVVTWGDPCYGGDSSQVQELPSLFFVLQDVPGHTRSALEACWKAAKVLLRAAAWMKEESDAGARGEHPTFIGCTPVTSKYPALVQGSFLKTDRVSMVNTDPLICRGLTSYPKK